MKDLRLAFLIGPLAALAGACPAAAASPAGDIAGTWECRQPGVQYRNKPPILYVADAGGWFKVQPAQGQQFMIRPEAVKQKTASMGLRFADAKNDYRCLRLPPSGATTFAPAQTAPATEGAPPAPADPSPATAVEPVAPPGTQDEGAGKKPQ